MSFTLFYTIYNHLWNSYILLLDNPIMLSLSLCERKKPLSPLFLITMTLLARHCSVSSAIGTDTNTHVSGGDTDC